VAKASFSEWSDGKPDYSQVQSRHESRYQTNDSFGLLIEELDAQREARADREVSLIESVRKQENIERGSNREEREQILRRAFGAADDSDDGGPSTPDIILNEAANVLIDVMDSLLAAK